MKFVLLTTLNNIPVGINIEEITHLFGYESGCEVHIKGNDSPYIVTEPLAEVMRKINISLALMR